MPFYKAIDMPRRLIKENAHQRRFLHAFRTSPRPLGAGNKSQYAEMTTPQSTDAILSVRETGAGLRNPERRRMNNECSAKEPVLEDSDEHRERRRDPVVVATSATWGTPAWDHHFSLE